MVFAWVERWLAQRRTREIMGVLFFLSIISLQLVGPLIAFYGHKSKPRKRNSCGRNSLRRRSRRPRPWLPLSMPRPPRVQYWTLCFLFYYCRSMELRFCGCLIFVCAGNIMAKISAKQPPAKLRRESVWCSIPAGICRIPRTRNRGLTE